jgi:hypothetical protein
MGVSAPGVETFGVFLFRDRPHSQRYQVVVRCQRRRKDGALTKGRRKNRACRGTEHKTGYHFGGVESGELIAVIPRLADGICAFGQE